MIAFGQGLPALCPVYIYEIYLATCLIYSDYTNIFGLALLIGFSLVTISFSVRVSLATIICSVRVSLA